MLASFHDIDIHAAAGTGTVPWIFVSERGTPSVIDDPGRPVQPPLVSQLTRNVINPNVESVGHSGFHMDGGPLTSLRWIRESIYLSEPEFGIRPRDAGDSEKVSGDGLTSSQRGAACVAVRGGRGESPES